MNRDGIWILNGRVPFVKLPAGNYIQATRVEHGAGPPAMGAAMMWRGQQRSINSDDLHISLGHTNDSNARETAKQMGIKMTRTRGYCDGCGEAKSIRRAVPRETRVKSGRPLQRVSINLTGPYPPPVGGARYCMLVVDDNTNVGWPLFLWDKSGLTLCHACRAWHNTVKLVAATYGGWDIARFDNGHEFTNAEFRKLLTELGIAVEYTPVDGAKRNGRVEGKLGLITERAKKASLEFPWHLQDLEFPNKALEWTAIWPEAFTWMNDCINMAQAHMPSNKLCPWEKLYKRRATSLPLPFMMHGVRHRNRKNKTESKGERCFYLNTGINHSSTTHKILLSSGVCSYSADVTPGYHRAFCRGGDNVGGRSNSGWISSGIDSSTCGGKGDRQGSLPRCVGEGGGGSARRCVPHASDELDNCASLSTPGDGHDTTAAVPGDTGGDEVGVAAYRYVGGVRPAETRREN